MEKIICFIIRGYRYCLSPMLGHHCRFYPSCSVYAEQAIVLHGIFKGGLLTLKRLLKCHPWYPGGEDPVPDGTTSKAYVKNSGITKING